MLPELLFTVDSLDGMLREKLRAAVQQVDTIPEQQFRSSSDEEVIDYVYGSTEVQPIELQADAQDMEVRETQVEVRRHPAFDAYDSSEPCSVKGVRVTVSTPFIGDPSLFALRPNQINLNPPRAKVMPARGGEPGYLDVVVETPLDASRNSERFKQEANGILSSVKWYLRIVNAQVLGHNQSLRGTIQHAVADRRQRLGTYATIVKAMNIPLRRKPGAPDVTKLAVRRRIVKPLPTKPPTRKEYGIADDVYDHILKVIRHEGRTFESTPSTFLQLDEEKLRDIMVAHLNGHYDGNATGETFRNHGKTDIRLEEKNRAAFVGECKVWSGVKALSTAMDQMLDYLTWRDCKAALIVFNKKVAGFSKIQDQIPQTLRKHSGFISSQSTTEAGEWRFMMRSADDPDRTILVHVFLFNLYVRP